MLLPRAAVAAVARAGALVLAARMPPQHSGWIQTSEGLWLPATYLLPVSGGRVSPEEAAAAHAEHEREAAAAFGDEAGGGASGGGGGDAHADELLPRKSSAPTRDVLRHVTPNDASIEPLLGANQKCTALLACESLSELGSDGGGSTAASVPVNVPDCRSILTVESTARSDDGRSGVTNDSYPSSVSCVVHLPSTPVFSSYTAKPTSSAAGSTSVSSARAHAYRSRLAALSAPAHSRRVVTTSP